MKPDRLRDRILICAEEEMRAGMLPAKSDTVLRAVLMQGSITRADEANSASVVSAYETRIEKLERDKIVLQERLAKSIPPKGRLEDCIELSLKFLSNPWNIWKNGDFALRQTVLRLAFSEPLRYSLNGVYGTPEFSSLSDT